MPAPTTAAELLDLIQRSGVADEAKLRAYIQKLRDSSSLPTDPAKLAGVLVRDGVLTYFQAEQILQGKYKRFTIGKYKVLEKLGAGGMAQVFLCEHKLMRRRVAIKVLPTAKAEDPSSLERFYREARAVAAVDHPNIVRAYDIDQDENLHFLVMEYVDGTNLQDLVKKVGPLDVLRACHYIYGASVGLQHAHESGLVHRDIKPGNILVDRAGVVKILDMGLARFFHDDDDALTKKYDENVLGTADYLAPEQALDSHAVDIRADIYSLGATFYYLLTGSAPFPEGSVAQKLIWHQNRPPRPVKSVRPEVPDEVVAVVEKMMAKTPEKRYQMPSDVMAALAGWVATPIPPPSDREMPQVSLAAGGTGTGGSARGPTTTIGPAVASPTVPAGAFGRTSAPGTGGAPVPATPEPGAAPLVWESLDTDVETQTVARGDTDPARPRTPAPRPRPRRAAATPGTSRKYLRVGLAALVLVVVAVAVYFAFFNKTDTVDPPPPPPPSGPRKITVSKAGGENAYPSLARALSAASAGDTIAIVEPRLIEGTLRLDRVKHRDLMIEGATADGRPPVVEASGGVRAMMLDATDVEGFRLQNVEFDGKTIAEFGVQISGSCPGVSVDRVTVRGVKSAAFRLTNASGPIMLDRVRAQLTAPTQIGVLLRGDNADTRRVTVRNSRFEGPGVGLRVEGPATDVEISGNRFFNLESAVSVARVPKGKAMQVQVTANTVFQVKTGIAIDTTLLAPNEPLGTFRLDINQNYFARTAAIASFTVPVPPVGPTSANNAFGAGSAAGNLPLTATLLPTPVLTNLDPNNDATFLRFPGGPPEVAPGKKAGAP